MARAYDDESVDDQIVHDPRRSDPFFAAQLDCLKQPRCNHNGTDNVGQQ